MCTFPSVFACLSAFWPLEKRPGLGPSQWCRAWCPFLRLISARLRPTASFFSVVMQTAYRHGCVPAYFVTMPRFHPPPAVLVWLQFFLAYPLHCINRCITSVHFGRKMFFFNALVLEMTAYFFFFGDVLRKEERKKKEKRRLCVAAFPAGSRNNKCFWTLAQLGHYPHNIFSSRPILFQFYFR